MRSPEYPKIETLLERNPDTHRVVPGAWRLPEFDYLKDLPWQVTEKVDGTNVRVQWDGVEVEIGGRTDAAQMPTALIHLLGGLFTKEKMAAAFVLEKPGHLVTLYGEGYGKGIQNGGGYIPDGVGFVLFDVLVEPWWLNWGAVEDVAATLGIMTAPNLGISPLPAVVKMVADGLTSRIGTTAAEGVVVRPTVPLCRRDGSRVIGKLKTKDFDGTKVRLV